ncbi:hypothetical protein [Stappia sp.]|jgi:hypothetical protein|uniref:hypothetical protein n=1 Tax=Stappia sp. TaxID=1870903 RepID=UPI003A9A10BD
MKTPKIKPYAVAIAVALTLSTGAAVLVLAETQATAHGATESTRAAADEGGRAAKSDLKLATGNLGAVEVRCVARGNQSTCTGWPVAAAFDVSGL